MKRTFLIMILMALGAMAALGQGPTKPPDLKLKVGDTAPDFTLPDLAGQKIKLSDLRGKSNVVLAFYVFAFTGG